MTNRSLKKFSKYAKSKEQLLMHELLYRKKTIKIDETSN